METADFASRYETDKTLEEEGRWVDLGDGIKIKVARTRSRRARAALTRLNKPLETRRLSGRPIPEAEQDKLTRRWVAEAILLDWEGVTDAARNRLDYSVDNALKVFEAFPDFLDDVVFFANQQETFRAEALEESRGNSPAPSDGS